MPTPSFADMLTPQQWLSRTSLFGKRRSPKLAVLDAAYARWYNQPYSDPDLSAAENLLTELNRFLYTKGGVWAKVNRNVASGGYMGRIYGLLREALAGNPRVKSITAKSEAEAARDMVREHMIPHSRMGVLYLLGSIDVDFDIVGGIVGGIGVLGSAATLGGIAGSTGIESSHADSHGMTAFSLSGHEMHPMTLASTPSTGFDVPGVAHHFDVPSVSLNTNQVVSAGKGVAAVVKNAAGGSGTKGHVGWQPSYMKGAHGARMGPALPPRPAPPLPPRPAPPAPSPASTGTSNLGELPSFPFEKYRNKPLPPTPVPAAPPGPVPAPAGADPSTWQAIKSTASKGAEDTARAVFVKMNLRPDEMAGYMGKAMKIIITQALTHILHAAVPYAGAGMRVATGIGRTIYATVEKVGAWLDRRRIVLLSGHPQAIASAIETQMEWAIGNGMIDFLRGGAEMTAQVFLPGMGSLASAILSALEWIARTIMRLIEVHRIKAFLKTAQEKYRELKNEHLHVEGDDKEPGKATSFHLELNKDRRDSIVYKAQEFAEFFDQGCKASPIIPMLTLNSGICTSLLTMVETVKDSGQVIDDAMAEAAVNYTRRLKTFTARYLRGAGFKFVPLNAKDEFLMSLLGHAVKDHQEVSTKVTRAIAGALA